MKKNRAYLIAYALEKKLETPIGVSFGPLMEKKPEAGNVIWFTNGEKTCGFSSRYLSEVPPKQTARTLLDSFQPAKHRK